MDKTYKRPLVLSILCVIAWMGAITSFIYFPRIIPSPALYISLLLVLIITTGVVGIWKMKKWGLYLYAVTVIVGSLYGSMTIPTLIFPSLMIIVSLVYYQRMQ